MIQYALVRDPGSDAAQGLTTRYGPPLCADQLRQQHRAYCDMLRSLGLELLQLDPLTGFPDAYSDVAFPSNRLTLGPLCFNLRSPGAG